MAGELNTVLAGEERRYPWKYGDMYYEVKGKKNARPLLLVHGFAPGASSHERSEEHTSELQSPCNLVCRLLLEKKKTTSEREQIKRRRSHPVHGDRLWPDPHRYTSAPPDHVVARAAQLTARLDRVSTHTAGRAP